MNQSRTHIAFLRKSQDFFDCYLLICKQYNEPILKFSVKYFLLCRSIELLFKSWMVYKRVPEKIIKSDISHDLEKALYKIQEIDLEKDLNLKLDRDLTNAILRLNNFYKPKYFEYPTLGYSELPLYIQFNQPIKLLLNKIEDCYRQNLGIKSKEGDLPLSEN